MLDFSSHSEILIYSESAVSAVLIEFHVAGESVVGLIVELELIDIFGCEAGPGGNLELSLPAFESGGGQHEGSGVGGQSVAILIAGIPSGSEEDIVGGDGFGSVVDILRSASVGRIGRLGAGTRFLTAGCIGEFEGEDEVTAIVVARRHTFEPAGIGSSFGEGSGGSSGINSVGNIQRGFADALNEEIAGIYKTDESRGIEIFELCLNSNIVFGSGGQSIDSLGCCRSGVVLSVGEGDFRVGVFAAHALALMDCFSRHGCAAERSTEANKSKKLFHSRKKFKVNL